MPLFGAPGERIAYTVYPGSEASAPPLVLLHGFTASAASFDANIAGLRDHFEVIVVELLGHGASDAPADSAPYAPEPAVDRLVGLFDELGYERVLLCGHSLGGALALRFALDAPDRLSGLVVLNSNSAAGTPEWRSQVRPGMVEMAARARAEGIDFMRKTRLYPAHSRRLDARSRELLMRDFDRLDPAGIAGTAEALVVDVNCYERLGELTVPTLVVLGDRDTGFVANAPAFVARLPLEVVRTARIEDAGHAANIEQPEVFESILVAFAAELGLVPDPQGAPRGRSGFGGRALTAVGVALVIGGVALLAASFLVGGDSANSSTLAAAPAVTATPTREIVTAVAGTRIAGPGVTTALVQGSAAPPPVASPEAPTASPTATAANTPPPTPTPLPPTATATAAAPTPSGPAAAISGASSAPVVGATLTFIDTSRPAGDVQDRVWRVSAPGVIVDQSNPAAISARFPTAGCYTVSLTVSFKAQPKIFSASVPVAVGSATCP